MHNITHGTRQQDVDLQSIRAGPRKPNAGLRWLPCQRFQPSQYTIPGNTRPTYDEDRIISTNSAEYIGPSFSIERRSYRLCSSRYCSQNNHVAHTIDTKEQLRKKSFESDSALFYCPIRHRVARAFGRRYSREPQLSKISRESCLGHIPTTMEQKLSQIFLTTHQSRIDNLEYCGLPFALVSHAVPPSRRRIQHLTASPSLIKYTLSLNSYY